MQTDDDTDVEIEAMAKVSRALSTLDEEARGRVIRWVSERYGIALASETRRKSGGVEGLSGSDGREEELEEERVGPETSPWPHFAELYHASRASTHPEGMLVAAYWVQVVNGQESFGSLELNRLLKDLGHGVTGTAKVMTSLIAKKPALMLQLKKSGRSQQARKTYKLTAAGTKTVEKMLANDT